MITARIDPARPIAKLDAMKERLRANVRGGVEDGAARLLSLVQAKLSGEVLQTRSGTLLRSIRAETNENANGARARVFSDGSVPYARIQEYGGRVNIPALTAVNAKALAFAWGGRMVFAKSVAAHVVDLPERSYMRSSLCELADTLTGEIRRIVADALS